MQKFFFLVFEKAKVNYFFPTIAQNFKNLAIHLFSTLYFFQQSLDSFWVITSFPYCFGKEQENYIHLVLLSINLEKVSTFLDIRSKQTKYTRAQAYIWSSSCNWSSLILLNAWTDAVSQWSLICRDWNHKGVLNLFQHQWRQPAGNHQDPEASMLKNYMPILINRIYNFGRV